MNNDFLSNTIKGLFPYSKNDAYAYYKNAIQIEDFIRQLKNDRFIVLSGYSGAGKTSFLNCVFNLESKDFSLVDESWEKIYLRPGTNPFKSIAYALSNIDFSLTKLNNSFVVETTNLLSNESNGLVELFEKYPIKPEKKLLFVIDPLDDLFLLASVISGDDAISQDKQIDSFINLICTFEQQRKGLPIYTVISFSNSFPEKSGKYPKFIDLIEKNKFLFKNLKISEVPFLIDTILPDNAKKAFDYDQFKELVQNDLEKEFSDNQEWLFFFQHALLNTISKWESNKKWELIKCYNHIGGISYSISNEADSILNKLQYEAQGKYEKIYEKIFRAFIDGKGQFVAKTYKQLVDVSSRLEKKDSNYLETRNYIEKNYINPFIHIFGEEGLGLFEVIRSIEEIDRAALLLDKNYISEADVITFRNSSLIKKWQRFESFQNLKIKLINEYEWYSRMAFENNEKSITNFPTTLKAYSIAIKDNNINQEEFNIINEIFGLNTAWENEYTDTNRKGFASLAETKMYLKNGIKFYTEEAIKEATEFSNKEKTKKRIVIYTISMILLILISYILFTVVFNEKLKLIKKYSCLKNENQIVKDYTLNIKLKYLEEGALYVDSVRDDVNTLNSLFNVLLDTLNTNKINISEKRDNIENNSSVFFNFSKKRKEFDSTVKYNDRLFQFVFNEINKIDSINNNQIEKRKNNATYPISSFKLNNVYIYDIDSNYLKWDNEYKKFKLITLKDTLVKYSDSLRIYYNVLSNILKNYKEGDRNILNNFIIKNNDPSEITYSINYIPKNKFTNKYTIVDAIYTDDAYYIGINGKAKFREIYKKDSIFRSTPHYCRCTSTD